MISGTIVMDLFNNCLWKFFTYLLFKAAISSRPGISPEICFHTLLRDPCEINHVEGIFFPLMSYLPGGKILNFPFLLNAHWNKVFFENLNEKSKHGTSFPSDSFSGMRALRKEALTAGGMLGDSHLVKVYALLPPRQLVCWLFMERSLCEEKNMKN